MKSEQGMPSFSKTNPQKNIKKMELRLENPHLPSVEHKRQTLIGNFRLFLCHTPMDINVFRQIVILIQDNSY